MTEPLSGEEESRVEWEGDVFKRKPYAVFLTKLLVSKADEAFVLNINAEWGTGKTFFLTKWEEDIRNRYPTIYFNAWKKDFAEDPFPALVSLINEKLSEYAPIEETDERQVTKYTKKARKLLTAAAPVLVKGLVKRYIGQDSLDSLITATQDTENIAADLASEVTKTILEPYEKAEQDISSFKKILKELLQDLGNDGKLQLPMFIFIDELDRCRPLFAIETLERVKHIFDIPQIKFVIATDTEQLSHSVKAIYGEGFDGRMYLRRFFSQEFALPLPNHINFAMMLFKTFPENLMLNDYYIADPPRQVDSNLTTSPADIKHRESVILFALFSDFFSLDLRTQQQCYDRLVAIVIATPENEKLHLAYLIFLIMLKERMPEKYKNYFLSSARNGDRDSIINSELPKKDCYVETKKLEYRMPGLGVVKYRAVEIAQIYLTNLGMERSQLREQHNDTESLSDVLWGECYNDYDKLKRYEELVDLVGRLS